MLFEYYIHQEAKRRGYDKYQIIYCQFAKHNTIGEKSELEATQKGFSVITDVWLSDSKDAKLVIDAAKTKTIFLENHIDFCFSANNMNQFKRIITANYPINIEIEKAKAAIHYIKVIPL